MSITSLALRFAAPLPKLESFQRYLFIGPHPDDIEIGAGATAARLRALGKEVCFLICTDGRYGDGAAPAGLSREELAALRRREAVASARVLGVEDVRFLNLSDGGFYTEEQLLHAMASVIGGFKPDCIFAPDPAVSSECHVDHLRCGRAAGQLAYMAPYAGVMAGYGSAPAPVEALAYYMTAKPSAYVKTRGCLERQLRSVFDCHRSQFPPEAVESRALRLYLHLRAADMGLRCGCTAAEGFRLLGRVHMHCLPEAGK